MSVIDRPQAPTVLSLPKPETRMQHLRESVLMGMARRLPAVPFTVLLYARFQCRLTTFHRPRRYSELVNHKKLYQHDPLFTRTADKYAVRGYVAEVIGDQYLIPVQQVVDVPEHISWNDLRGRVVIKGTHGSNMTMIIDTRRAVDIDMVNEKAHKWLQTDWYSMWKEWAYRDITPRLIIENFIGADGEPPADFKFHVINGRVEMIQVDTDRFTGHKCTLFNRDWRQFNVGAKFDIDLTTNEPPVNIEQMIRLAETLAKPFEYGRIDLYNVDGRIYFGEITHYPGAAAVRFDPPTFDDALGELWLYGTPIPEEFYVKS